jgi:hypothetical protein
MKKTLELTLCESEGVKIEVSSEVERIETDNPAIHPDSPNQGTITEYWCKDVEWIKLNGIELILRVPNLPLLKEISKLIESQLEENPELFEGGYCVGRKF